MKPILEYLDYREFLRDFYEEKKRSNYFFSFRYLARKIGMDHSLLVKVLSRKRHITENHIRSLAKICGLTGREAAYWEALVHYGKSRTEAQMRMYLDKMLAMHGSRAAQLERDRYDYFAKWYYIAIRSLLDYYPFRGNYKDLGSCLNPPIGEKQAREAVELLERLNFIGHDAEGLYHVKEQHVTTGEKWKSALVRNYQLETIRLSTDSLGRDAPEIRDISSVTMSIDKECFEDVKDIVRACRENIVRRVDEISAKNRDRVYQLNIQFIPLTGIGEGNGSDTEK